MYARRIPYRSTRFVGRGNEFAFGAVFKILLVTIGAIVLSKGVVFADSVFDTGNDFAKSCMVSVLPALHAEDTADVTDFGECLLMSVSGREDVSADNIYKNTLCVLNEINTEEAIKEKEDMAEEEIYRIAEVVEPTFAPIPENKLPILDVNTSTGAVKGYYSTCGVYMNNQSSHTPDLDSLLYAPLPFKLDNDGPQVLVISTHATEGYSERTGNWYDENDPSRSQDITKNVVRVGQEVAKALNDNGIYALHETALNDYPSYNGSYTRTLEVIEWYLEKYPSIKSVIDVHRDSMVRGDGTALRPIAKINGERYAQVMIVAGTDEGGLANPDWECNLNYAVKITNEMNKQYPTLAKPVNLRKERFNMHLTHGSLIAEVGTNVNTLEEAVRSGRALGECIANVLKNG